MRYFFLTFLLCAGLCGAAGAKCYAAEVINVPDRADIVVNEDGSVNVYEYDSVSGNDIPDHDHDQDTPLTSDSLLSILESFSRVSDADLAEEEETEDNIVLDSVSSNDVGWDVIYFDHTDDDGNLVTSKFTQSADGPTLYFTQEDYPGGLQTFASYSTYYGLISSQYLDMFRGLAAKLGINEHYVCARTSQYQYIFAHGNLKLSGKQFSGNNIIVVTYHTDNNGYFSSAVESSFSLNAQNYIVYSDLGKDFPSLLENHDIYSRALFFLCGIVIIAYFINSFFGKGVVTNALRKSNKREVY